MALFAFALVLKNHPQIAETLPLQDQVTQLPGRAERAQIKVPSPGILSLSPKNIPNQN